MFKIFIGIWRIVYWNNIMMKPIFFERISIFKRYFCFLKTIIKKKKKKKNLGGGGGIHAVGTALKLPQNGGTEGHNATNRRYMRRSESVTKEQKSDNILKKTL